MAKYGKVVKNDKEYYRTRKTLPNGTMKTILGKTVAEVDEKLAQLMAENKMTNKEKVPTVEAHAMNWLNLKEGWIKPSTYIGYAIKIRNYIVKPLGGKLLTEVSSDDIVKAVKDLSNYSESFCHEIRMLYKGIFSDAVARGYIAKNPTDIFDTKQKENFLHGKKPVKDNMRKKALSDEQVALLLAAVKGLQVETFVRLGLEAGLRREESLALTWDNVLLDDITPRILVQKAWRLSHNRPIIDDELKTKAAYREIPISTEFTAFLKAKRDVSSSEYVISNSEYQPLTGSQWRNLWKQVTTRTTMPHKYKRRENGEWIEHVVTPVLGAAAKNNPGVIYSLPFHVTSHMLRHTYISRLILAGVNPKTVQVVVGHTNSKMTMDVYAELTENRPEQIAKQIFSKIQG